VPCVDRNGDCYTGYNATNQVFPTKIDLYLTPGAQ